MTDEIRLLVLNCEYPPIGGGAARATEYILNELEGFPVRWTLVTSSAGDTIRVREHGEKGRIECLPVGKRDLYFWRKRELLAYAYAACRRVRKLEAGGERYDLCHAFFTLPAAAVAMFGAKRRPYIVSLRGSDVPGRTGRFVWFYRAFGFAFGAIWKRAAAVVANSQELKELASARAPDIGIEVIPNGVDTRKFHPAEKPPGTFTVVTVGRLSAGKDTGTAIRAAALVRARFPRARLVIAGEGPQKEQLQGLAREAGVADRVEFRSWLSWQQIDEVYREADVFILTSLREGMSNTVLEALASGLPVVASKAALSGIDAPGAAVVPPGDAEAAAGAIARYFADDTVREEAARASLAAARKYTWRAAAEGYYNLYRRAIEKHGRGSRQ